MKVCIDLYVAYCNTYRVPGSVEPTTWYSKLYFSKIMQRGQSYVAILVAAAVVAIIIIIIVTGKKKDASVDPMMPEAPAAEMTEGTTPAEAPAATPEVTATPAAATPVKAN